MQPSPPDLAQVRLNNALALFEEFVRATARHADAATLKGLERRFAERIDIQPSYWSQLKSRSRQIGERLARQFEQRCQKPAGWLDRAPGEAGPTGPPAAATSAAVTTLVGLKAQGRQPTAPNTVEGAPQDDDERFIVSLVLTYYRRHPLRARARLLDLLGEVLVPQAPTAAAARPAKGPGATAPTTSPSLSADEQQGLWQRVQSGVAPLKPKPRK